MTDTDRDLLERAARAAGPEVFGEPGCYFRRLENHCVTGWNSLQDDGDAWRLAVKRHFTVAVRPHEVEVFSDETGECLASISTEGADPCACARRAITMAAALGDAK